MGGKDHPLVGVAALRLSHEVVEPRELGEDAKDLIEVRPVRGVQERSRVGDPALGEVLEPDPRPVERRDEERASSPPRHPASQAATFFLARSSVVSGSESCSAFRSWATALAYSRMGPSLMRFGRRSPARAREGGACSRVPAPRVGTGWRSPAGRESPRRAQPASRIRGSPASGAGEPRRRPPTSACALRARGGRVAACACAPRAQRFDPTPGTPRGSSRACGRRRWARRRAPGRPCRYPRAMRRRQRHHGLARPDRVIEEDRSPRARASGRAPGLARPDSRSSFGGIGAGSRPRSRRRAAAPCLVVAHVSLGCLNGWPSHRPSASGVPAPQGPSRSRTRGGWRADRSRRSARPDPRDTRRAAARDRRHRRWPSAASIRTTLGSRRS